VSRPTFTVIAGANGGGKSTLTAGNVDIFGAIPVLNPDVFVNILHSSGTGNSAGPTLKTPIAAGVESSQHKHMRELRISTTLLRSSPQISCGDPWL
jgi:predicted ABC-type ATPase